MLNIFEQYISDEPSITIKVSHSLNAEFIEKFVAEYRVLLLEKKKLGNSFLDEVKKLIFSIDGTALGEEDDFDLLFISYLTLFKLDFPNVEIELHFEDQREASQSNSYLFKLMHHKTHLYINSGLQVFALFRNGTELKSSRIVQSVSYIPPLIINTSSLESLFKKKHTGNDYRIWLYVLQGKLKQDPIIASQQKDPVYNRIQDIYNEHAGKIENWSFSNLSTLYFIKTLSELYVLRHLVNSITGIKSHYQIGNSIVESKDDKQSARKFRDSVLNTINTNGVFEFSDVEMYIFSLVVQNSNLFKIPSSTRNIHRRILPLLTEAEKKKVQNYETNKASEKYLKFLFIAIYVNNLQRIIEYTKDIVYGLQELAKNIVEHSGEAANMGCGVISARIYTSAKVKSLKNITPSWLNRYDSKHKFIDINVIDTGFKSVVDTYKETLIKEHHLLQDIDDTKIRAELQDAYLKDINHVSNYNLNNFFNFDSLKLFHQINRTKARLGLLIFAQTILHDKKAFVSLASNNLMVKDNIGYFLFSDGNKIIDLPNTQYLTVGTNLNFVIPVGEEFEYRRLESGSNDNRTSSASSVFQELYDYGFEGTPLVHLREIEFKRAYEGFDKYSKLDSLQSEIGKLSENEILVIDAQKVAKVLENSSDWIRFLAGLQFTSDAIVDIIIINFDVTIYQELVNVLKLFSNAGGAGSSGFWKKDRFILFFFPIKYDTDEIFWFNSLLFSYDYGEFMKINSDIDLYHQNLSRLLDEPEGKHSVVNYDSIQSKLFSSSKKLLNFELLIKNEKGVTLFEETLKSLLNITIDKDTDEN